MANNTVFVTGATGRIGRPMVKKLISKGYRVCGYGLGEQYTKFLSDFDAIKNTGLFNFEIGSILDQGALMHSMRGAGTVIHLAAMVDPKRTETKRLRCIDINVEGTRAVLNAALANGVKQFLFASSAAVYGEPENVPVTESHNLAPTSLYGLTKVMAEETIQAFAKEFPALTFSILRLFGTYGNGDNPDLVVESFAKQAMMGEAISIFGDGKDIRCFTHVEDVIKAFILAMNNNTANGRIYNIGNPNTVCSVLELARKVNIALGKNGPDFIKFTELSEKRKNRAIGQSYADITRACKDIGFSPEINLETGLSKIADRLNTRET